MGRPAAEATAERPALARNLRNSPRTVPKRDVGVMWGVKRMADEIDMHLGRRLRKRRRLLGLTQQQLAEACGVRFQQIQKYECGANRMSAARLWLLAEALQAPVSYFFEGLSGGMGEGGGPEGRGEVLARKETR